MDGNQLVVVSAYCAMVEDYVAQGWQAFLVSFMFEPLAGSERSKIMQMERHLTAAFGIFVSRAVRNPKRKAARGRLPILLCCPDLPVLKNRTMTLREVDANDGLHYQAILLMPPYSRMDDVAGHFRSMRATYRKQARLERVHVVPITRRPGYTTGYVLKQVSRGRFSTGDILPFPRTRSELAA